MCQACEYVSVTAVGVLVYWKLVEKCLCVGHCSARLCLRGGKDGV